MWLEESLPEPQRSVEVGFWSRAGLRGDGADSVIEEVPVAIVCNGISQAVMLASPTDLEDFAVGFALTEGLIDTLADLRDVELVPVCNGIEARLSLGHGAMERLRQRRRSLSGKTGCGLCGVESLDHAIRDARIPAPEQRSARFARAAILRACAELDQCQALHQATGAAHAAGFADRSGQLVAVREDVGRHNALDKLIGMLASTRQVATEGFIVVTSRASYEMVQKAAMLGCQLLAALSAPTALAIRHAEASGMTLIGFAGREKATIYTRPDRCWTGGREAVHARSPLDPVDERVRREMPETSHSLE